MKRENRILALVLMGIALALLIPAAIVRSRSLKAVEEVQASVTSGWFDNADGTYRFADSALCDDFTEAGEALADLRFEDPGELAVDVDDHFDPADPSDFNIAISGWGFSGATVEFTAVVEERIAHLIATASEHQPSSWCVSKVEVYEQHDG